MNAKVFIFNDDNATLTGGAVDNECFDMLLRAMQKHDEEKSKSSELEFTNAIREIMDIYYRKEISRKTKEGIRKKKEREAALKATETSN